MGDTSTPVAYKLRHIMFRLKKIVILLAAYNGESHICEQLRSIQRQTISSWTLLARDDGSTDATKNVLEEFAATDERIQILNDELGGLGATRNFGELMRASAAQDADVVFFSDQDDVWSPDKMWKQLQSLDDLERRCGAGIPLLTYSDMEVVDERLCQIHPSFMRYQRQQHEPRDPIHVLLTQNFVAGCTVAINRKLLEFAIPLPDKIQLHDWWLAVCAAACGRMAYINEPLVRYRQHSSNQIGAVTVPGIFNFFSATYRKHLSSTRQHMLKPTRQAFALSERIKNRNVDCRPEVCNLIDRFASCMEQGLMGRLLTVYRLPLRRQGLARRCLWILRLVLMRKPREVKTAVSTNQ
jgi:rhamnosyltransferase